MTTKTRLLEIEVVHLKRSPVQEDSNPQRILNKSPRKSLTMADRVQEANISHNNGKIDLRTNYNNLKNDIFLKLYKYFEICSWMFFSLENRNLIIFNIDESPHPSNKSKRKIQYK